MASPKRVWTLAVAMLACCLSGGALAQDAMDLTGIWRDDRAQKDMDEAYPVLETNPKEPDRPHGTYRSLPYILIMRNNRHELHVYTDVGALRAVLRPVPSDPKTYQIVDASDGAGDKVLGVLKIRTEACGSKRRCFQIVQTPGVDIPWPNTETTLYIPTEIYDPEQDPPLPEKYTSNFSPVSNGNAYAGRSYDITDLDRENIQVADPQNTGRIPGQLFVDGGAPYSYQKSPFGAASVDVPFGWTLSQIHNSVGGTDTKTIETGREMEELDLLDIGMNAKVNLFGVKAKTSVDVSTAKRIDQMTKNKSVVAQSQYVSTKYALVLNRRRTILSPDFKQEVEDCKGKAETDICYDVVVNHWGTHYANAVTLGTRGYARLTLNEDVINSSDEKKKELKVAASLLYEGNGGGFTVGTNSETLREIQHDVGSEVLKFGCYGGSGCSEGGVPNDGDLVPIYLDLRPLSDLLAPPFFLNDDEIYGRVRQNLAKKIADRAYVERNNLDDPMQDLSTVKVVNPTSGRPQLLCSDNVIAGSRACCSLWAFEPLNDGEGSRPAVAALTLKGMDPLKRKADAAIPDSQWDAEHWRSLDIGDGQTVRLSTSADPTPIVANVTIDYDFREMYPKFRNDSNHRLVHWPNIRRYCQARYGDGWTGNLKGQQASCTTSSDTQQVDVQAVCNDDAAKGGFGSTIAVWNELEQAWMCGFHSDPGVRLVPYCQSIGIVHPHPKLLFGLTPIGPTPAECDDGSSLLDATEICNDALGRGFASNGFDLGSAQQNPEASCSGTFAEAHEATGVKEAAILTYPGRTPYDPRATAAGSTTDVVVPLQWKGDSEKVCQGESIALVIGLQRGAKVDLIDALLSSP